MKTWYNYQHPYILRTACSDIHCVSVWYGIVDHVCEWMTGDYHYKSLRETDNVPKNCASVSCGFLSIIKPPRLFCATFCHLFVSVLDYWVQ